MATWETGGVGARIAGGLVLVLALGAGLAAAAGGVLLTAAVTSTPALFLSGGLVALLLVTWLLGWGGFRLLGADRSQWRAALLSGGFALLVAVLTIFTLLQPFPVSPIAAAPAGVRFWDLETGSRIAYVMSPATGPRQPEPLIFLHGGPGTPGEGLPTGTETFNAAGFDVYAYDQLGAGRSSRLDDVTDYTLARQIADLEAVRATIGVERIIPVGQSWGGTLAANYLAAHPERVGRIVFTSPGVLWLPAMPEADGNPWNRLGEAERIRFAELTSDPRFLLQGLLLETNPNAAHALVPDAEADARFHELALTGKDTTGCPGAPPARVHDNQQGFYVNQVTVADLANTPDPRPVLRTLETPVLILRGACDFVAWQATVEYRDTLPKATLVLVPGVGHAIAGGNPDLYTRLIDAFLRDQPLPLPPYTAATAPE